MVVISIILYVVLAGCYLMGKTKSGKISMIVGTCLSSFLAYWYLDINNVAMIIYLVMGLICILFCWVATSSEDVGTGKPRNKYIAGLLAFFLGGYGIHRFYLRKNIAGLFYILFCWTLIPWIIGIIEAIRFFVMSREKFDMRYNTDTKTATENVSQRRAEQAHEESFVWDTCEDDEEDLPHQDTNERDGDNLDYRDIRLCGYKATAVGTIEDFSIAVKAHGRTYHFKTKDGNICSCRSSNMRAPKYYEVT